MGVVLFLFEYVFHKKEAEWQTTAHTTPQEESTVKILKFGTPQTIAIIVLKIEKFDVTLH